MRSATVNRKTRETQIKMRLDLDGSGDCKIDTELGFLTHMLETFAKHGLFDLEAKVKGDLHVDQHHTVEDAGIVLGMVFKKTLGDKAGIQRAGFFNFPMDEALARVALDISGRPFLRWDVTFTHQLVGELEIGLFEDFFLGMTNALGMNLHIEVPYGRSDHHKIEAVFKAVARAMRMACTNEPRLRNKVLSTKGVL